MPVESSQRGHQSDGQLAARLDGVDDLEELLRHRLACMVNEALRHLEELLRDCAGDGAHGVCVAAQVNRVANGGLEVVRLEESDKGLGDGLLAGIFEAIPGRAQTSTRPGEVVTVDPRDVLANLSHWRASAGKVAGRRGGLRALDSFLVVVGDRPR